MPHLPRPNQEEQYKQYERTSTNNRECYKCKSTNISHYSEFNCCLDEECRNNSSEYWECNDCGEVYYREHMSEESIMRPLDDVVDEMMAEENIRVDVKQNGRWVDEVKAGEHNAHNNTHTTEVIPIPRIFANTNRVYKRANT